MSGVQAPEYWPVGVPAEDRWTPADRAACYECGRFVPTETVQGSRSHEYDDWLITGECKTHGRTDVVVVTR